MRQNTLLEDSWDLGTTYIWSSNPPSNVEETYISPVRVTYIYVYIDIYIYTCIG